MKPELKELIEEGIISEIEIVEFLDEDIVRSNMCKQIIMAYRD